jgi:hypothetical protein
MVKQQSPLGKQFGDVVTDWSLQWRLTLEVLLMFLLNDNSKVEIAVHIH